LNVTGITTLANVAIENVNISGVATFADITYDEITGRNLNLTGIATIPSQANLNVTGLATIPTISNTPSFSAGAVVTGVVTASQFSGDGSQLTGLGIGINTTSGLVGYGFTHIHFKGAGVSTTNYNTNLGIATIFFEGGGGGISSVFADTTPKLGGNLDLNGNNITGSGNIPAANLTGTLPAISGANLTNLDGSNITTGTISADRVDTLNQNTSGNAATATALQNARLIGGVSFNGTVNINLPGVNQAGTQDTSGTAANATNATNINLADESSDTTCFPVFTTEATGNQAPKTDADRLTYNSSVGTLHATNFNTTSDINLKKDIEIIENANNILSQIRGVNFTWIDNDKPAVGVIAQDIEKVLPQLVDQRSDTGTKSVCYNGLIGVLIEAVKELSQRVEYLERT